MVKITVKLSKTKKKINNNNNINNNDDNNNKKNKQNKKKSTVWQANNEIIVAFGNVGFLVASHCSDQQRDSSPQCAHIISVN